MDDQVVRVIDVNDSDGDPVDQIVVYLSVPQSPD
jgi:hypothetical protein